MEERIVYARKYLVIFFCFLMLPPVLHGQAGRGTHLHSPDGNLTRSLIPESPVDEPCSIIFDGGWSCRVDSLNGSKPVKQYERNFMAPPGWKNKRLLLNFSGITGDATVWINGMKAREYKGCEYTAFDVELFKKFRIGENHLVVRVENNEECGIYGDVTLKVAGKPGFSAVVARLRPEGKEMGNGTLTVNLLLTRKLRSSAMPVYLVLELSADSPAPKTILLQRRELLTAADKAAFFTYSLDSLQYWNTDRPSLYRLDLKLIQDSGLLDMYSTVLGMRSVKLQQEWLLLNGKPLKPFDAEGLMQSGPSTPVAEVIQHLKSISSSGIRTVHFHWMQQPAVYDSCDRLGIAVLQDLPLWSMNLRPIDDSLQTRAYRRICSMLNDHANHPCIVSWKIGLEYGHYPQNAMYVDNIIRFISELDPARPVVK